MATTETQLAIDKKSLSESKAAPASKTDRAVLDQVLNLLSSVRFGILMLMLLLVCCLIGMLVMQQNVEGFADYYERLTPAQRALYERLDFFNIYHAWYFTALLAVTGLSIVLSSIDRFPTAWQYVRKPKRAASTNFIRAQMFNQTADVPASSTILSTQVVAAWRRQGLRPQVSAEHGRITVFAQRHVWNRLGAYAVHVALLLILAGGFLTSRYGVGGFMEIVPGESAHSFAVSGDENQSGPAAQASLPFTVECTDLQQQLIRPEGGLEVMNTIDWLSFIRIKDEGRELDALVHLNAPFDYRGYRFFQSSFQPSGYARQVTVRFSRPGEPPREVTIDRNGSAEVEGIGQVAYDNFYPDFRFDKGRAISVSGDFNNPVAELRITDANGKSRREFAYGAEAGGGAPAEGEGIFLQSFEKVAVAHTLTVQYDPGRTPVYLGFALLTLSLCAVFFFAHQRVWAVIEPEGRGSQIYFGGNTNRNRPAFEARFSSLVNAALGGTTDHESSTKA